MQLFMQYNHLMDSYKFIDGVYVYFVTFTIIDWLPIFINPEPIEIITESLRYCINNKNLRIHAYVIMPNHIHLIVFDSNFDNDRLEKTLTAFRKFTGNKLANFIDNTLAESLSLVIRSKALTDRIRQVWRPGWHAEGLASESFLFQKMNYIHENPVRKGLVKFPEHWTHSSAAYWINEGESEIPIVPFT
jgi:putative transposase